jgi:hypothetical protein
VIAIPADATTDVQEDFRHIEQDGRDLIGEIFRGMKVARVEAIDLLALDGVTEIKLVGADTIRFRSDAEKFRLDRVEMGIQLFVTVVVPS